METTATTIAACNLVATGALAAKLFPEATARNSAHGKPGIVSCDVSFDPSDCSTKFGRWLAEHVPTTRRDDDMSRVMITLASTEAEIALAAFADSLKSMPIHNADTMEVALKKIEAWAATQRKVAAGYGDHLYTRRTIEFEWPVLGSRSAEGIESAAAYFDLCAVRIRAMKPMKVRLWNGQEPPVELQVCR
jgi:hypothetical protein